ncbi:MAG: CvpA family protein [Carboxylicivirga sp.]|jgi:membrane protein required for colicin V production|nr:CvpA family protein [Carboxylicivirga sp.]
MSLNYFDIIIGILLILAIVKGFKNGLVIELASLAALVLGLYGAIKFSSITESYLVEHIHSSHIGLIAFIVTFALIVVGVHLLARVVDKLVKAIALGIVNRVLGALFSLLKYAFILSVILAIVDGFERNFNIIPQEQKEKSILYEPLSAIAPTIFPYLQFDKVKEKVGDVKKGIEV